MPVSEESAYIYTDELAEKICQRIAGGESLNTICASGAENRDPGIPSSATVYRWLRDFPEFLKRYNYARELQAEYYADQIVAIADGTDTPEEGTKPPARDHNRDRLRVDARKWVAAHLLPKKYGDRTVLAGDPDAPLNVNATTARDRAKAMALLVARSQKADG